MPLHKRRVNTIRGSTLIYHSKMVRSRMHFPTTDTDRAYSQRPGLSARLVAVLFPFTAIFNFDYFIIYIVILSRKTVRKVKNIIAQSGELCYSILRKLKSILWRI